MNHRLKALAGHSAILLVYIFFTFKPNLEPGQFFNPVWITPILIGLWSALGSPRSSYFSLYIGMTLYLFVDLFIYFPIFDLSNEHSGTMFFSVLLVFGGKITITLITFAVAKLIRTFVSDRRNPTVTINPPMPPTSPTSKKGPPTSSNS